LRSRALAGSPLLALLLFSGLLFAGLLFSGTPGCWNEIAAPSQGFIAIDADGVGGVEVFVDGESRGTSSRVGPLEAGTHTVSIAKTYYDVSPASVEVTVQPAETATASFDLLLVAPGEVTVTAVDEILGTEVTGAEILVDFGAGLMTTGVSTPGTVTNLPPGPLTVHLRRAGFEDAAVSATIVSFDNTDVEAAMAPPRAVLGEMFTFVSCSGCPESAEELSVIRNADPDRFYVIEWHSQIPFPLYDTRWEDRQAFYVGDVDVPKPAVLFQGGPMDAPRILIGSASAELAAYHDRVAAYLAQCDTDCPVALRVLGSLSSGGADYDVRVLWRGGTLPAGLFLHVVLQENHVISPGNQPYFDFVPRDLAEETVIFSSPGQILTFTGSFGVEATWLPEELRLVAYVQSSATGEILAVGGI
jgi:hypothetical protein